MYLVQQSIFVVRNRLLVKLSGWIRNSYFRLCGMQIGKATYLPRIRVTWPHKVKIGNHCSLESGTVFKFEGIWSGGSAILIGDNIFIGSNCEFNIASTISIGDNTLIASGCKFIDHDHGMELKELITTQRGVCLPIVIGNDVWLGCNVVVVKGITIEDGAVIGAGSILTKSVRRNEIWAGVPARKIGERK